MRPTREPSGPGLQNARKTKASLLHGSESFIELLHGAPTSPTVQHVERGVESSKNGSRERERHTASI